MKDGRDGRRLFCASVHFFITDELLIAQLCLLLSYLLVAFVEGGKILDPIYTRPARDIMAVRRLPREVDERCAALYSPTIIISNGGGC